MVRGSFLLLLFSIMRFSRDSKLVPTLPDLLSGGRSLQTRRMRPLVRQFLTFLSGLTGESEELPSNSNWASPGKHLHVSGLTHTTATESRVGSGTVPF